MTPFSVSRRTVLRTVAVATVGAIALLTAIAPASQAMRHLRLVRSFPAKDTVLTIAPDAVRLWLSEPTQAPVSKVTVTAAAGDTVKLEALTREAAADAPLVGKFTKPVGAGQYTVTWKAMSKDGHVVNGTFGFRVNPAK
jgi:methionine-rich copper-binding protein CopC